MIAQSLLVVLLSVGFNVSIPRDLGYFFQQPSQSAVITGSAFNAAVSAWDAFSRICGCNSNLKKYKVVIHLSGSNYVVDFFKGHPKALRDAWEAQYLVSPNGRILGRSLTE